MATLRVFNHHVHTSFYWLALVDTALFVLSLYAGTYIYCLVQLGSANFQDFLPVVPGRDIGRDDSIADDRREKVGIFVADGDMYASP